MKKIEQVSTRIKKALDIDFLLIQDVSLYRYRECFEENEIDYHLFTESGYDLKITIHGGFENRLHLIQQHLLLP